MDLGQLLNFYNTARFRSFTRAAKLRFITQSAISQQIKSLELEFGLPLFERYGKKKIELTEAGEIFFIFCGEFINNYNKMLDEFSAMKQPDKGRITLAAPFTTLYHLLPPVIRQFRALNPAMEISVLDKTQKNVMDSVSTGETDFGFVLESMAGKNFNTVKWKRLETVLIVSDNHPLANRGYITLDDAGKYPLIFSNDPDSIERREIEDYFIKNRIDYKIIMENSNVELSSLYAELGLGVAFATMVKGADLRHGRKIRLIEVRGMKQHKILAMIMKKNRFLPKYKADFINLITGSQAL